MGFREILVLPQHHSNLFGCQLQDPFPTSTIQPYGVGGDAAPSSSPQSHTGLTELCSHPSTLQNFRVGGTAPPQLPPPPPFPIELRELQPLSTLPVPYSPYGIQGVAAPPIQHHTTLWGLGPAGPLSSTMHPSWGVGRWMLSLSTVPTYWGAGSYASPSGPINPYRVWGSTCPPEPCGVRDPDPPSLPHPI